MRRQPNARSAIGVVLAALFAGSLPAGAQAEEAGAADQQAEKASKATVECLLPAEIDRLGSQLTKLAPRRTIETTSEECAERKGEVVEEPR